MLDVAGVSVPVRDMGTGLDFYGRLLGRPPTVDDEVYSLFEVDGVQLGLLAGLAGGREPQPLLRTTELEREWARIGAWADVGDIEEHNGYRLFLLTDADGHTVEVYESRQPLDRSPVVMVPDLWGDLVRAHAEERRREASGGRSSGSPTKNRSRRRRPKGPAVLPVSWRRGQPDETDEEARASSGSLATGCPVRVLLPDDLPLQA